jgi:hypothetical protein
MTSSPKILSFFVAVVTWLACIVIAFVVPSYLDGLKVEDAHAILPYALFSVLLAATCVVIGARLTASRATITGIAVGLLPSAALLTSGVLTFKGVEAWFNICLAVGSGVGTGLGALFSSRIQRSHS